MKASFFGYRPGPGAARLGLVPAAGLLQGLLVLRTYGKLLLHPGRYWIMNNYDGSEHLHWLAWYLRQPLSQGLLAHGQNYPFGEYIFFLDIAPLLSVLLHGLVRAVPALAPYGLYLYDAFFLSGLVVSSLLLASILRRLAVPSWLALVLSLTLPWLSPQTFRFNVGQTALAYTPALLLALWLLQGLYRAGRAGQPTGRWWAGLGLAVVAASWVHFYYLGVLVGWLTCFFIGWGLGEVRAGRPWRPLAGRVVAWLGAVVASTFGLLQVLDPRHAERPIGSAGYGWIEWKFQLGALFRAHESYKIRFPLERTAAVPYESMAYLGAFVLYGLLVVGGLALVSWRQRARGQGPASPLLPALPPPTEANRAFVGLLLLASLPLALAALGETIAIDNGNYLLVNYLDPFLWLHKATERITQFRALGRFIWPFWWAVGLGFSWYAGLAWRQATAQRRRGLQGLWVGLAGLAVVDMLNFAHFEQVDTQRDSLFASPSIDAVRALVGRPEAGRYQALLPIPYYHSGSEDLEQPYVGYNPDDAYCNYTYQLGWVTGLPLLSHRATRTPSAQARELMSMFEPGGPSPALLARLDKRPILVCLDSTFYTGEKGAHNAFLDQLQNRPEMLALFKRMPALVHEQHMRLLRREGLWSLYEWRPKK